MIIVKVLERLIRTTEGTVLARLPPRIEVRAKARIEIPHIMVLINDPEYTVIDPYCLENVPEPLYEGELMGEEVRQKVTI